MMTIILWLRSMRFYSMSLFILFYHMLHEAYRCLSLFATSQCIFIYMRELLSAWKRWKIKSKWVKYIHRRGVEASAYTYWNKSKFNKTLNLYRSYIKFNLLVYEREREHSEEEDEKSFIKKQQSHEESELCSKMIPMARGCCISFFLLFLLFLCLIF